MQKKNEKSVRFKTIEEFEKFAEAQRKTKAATYDKNAQSAWDKFN